MWCLFNVHLLIVIKIRRYKSQFGNNLSTHFVWCMSFFISLRVVPHWESNQEFNHVEQIFSHVKHVNKVLYGKLILIYPAAMPILRISKCQYSWAKPIKPPQTEKRMTAIDSKRGLENNYHHQLGKNFSGGNSFFAQWARLAISTYSSS